LSRLGLSALQPSSHPALVTHETAMRSSAFPRAGLWNAPVNLSPMATREDLHRTVDALSDVQVERARIVVIDEVDQDTSIESILARHGEQRLRSEEFEEQFGDLPRDGEG
jgi:hypothetical protein